MGSWASAHQNRDSQARRLSIKGDANLICQITSHQVHGRLAIASVDAHAMARVHKMV